MLNCFIFNLKEIFFSRSLISSGIIFILFQRNLTKFISIFEKTMLPISISLFYRQRLTLDLYTYHFSNSFTLLTHPSLSFNNPLPLNSSLHHPPFPLSSRSPFHENSSLIASNELIFYYTFRYIS